MSTAEGPDSPQPQPESTGVVFEGAKFRVEVQRWRGDVRRDVVRHPGACAAAVLVGDDRVVLVRQLREAVRRVTLEVPAGTYDVPGETPEEAMRREIREETGHRVTRLEALGSILTTPGFTDERIDLFVAWAEPDGDPEEEGITVVTMSVAEAVAAARDGSIEDAKSVVALLWLADRVG
jgi:ADP-ribose pyrophosphatase